MAGFFAQPLDWFITECSTRQSLPKLKHMSTCETKCTESTKIVTDFVYDFPRLSRPALGSTQPPIQYVRGHSRG